MKKIGALFLLLCAGLVPGQALPLSAEGRAEAALYMDVIRAFYAQQQNETAACAYYEKALRRAPQNPYLKRQMLACRLADDRLEEADAYADYITQPDPDAEDLAVYALYRWRKGDLKNAQDYYEQALAQAPEDPRIFYQYVLLLSFLDVDRAAQILQQRKAEYPAFAHVIDYETGNIYRSKKDIPTALKYYNQATQRNPDYAEAYLARAEVYEKTSQLFLMLHELEELEKIGYQSAAMYSRMASVYVLVKDHAKAREYFLKAKALDAGDNPANYFLALYAEEAGQYAQAAQYLRDSADFAAQAGKWLQVAFYEQRSGNPAQALQTLKQAYARFDKNVEVGYFYALALMDAQDSRRAARVLAGVLQTNPQYENARLAYAFALEDIHRYRAMEEQVRAVIAQNPQNAAAYNLLGFSLAERKVRLDEAQELVTQALALRPDDRAFADSLAWVYYQQGKYTQALELLQSLGEAFVRQNPEVSYHLGAAYAQTGQPEQARPWLERAAKDIRPAAKLLKKLGK